MDAQLLEKYRGNSITQLEMLSENTRLSHDKLEVINFVLAERREKDDTKHAAPKATVKAPKAKKATKAKKAPKVAKSTVPRGKLISFKESQEGFDHLIGATVEVLDKSGEILGKGEVTYHKYYEGKPHLKYYVVKIEEKSIIVGPNRIKA